MELFTAAASANPTFYADLTNPQSLNKYAYCYNNPLRYTDPDGHIVETLWDIANIGMDAVSLYQNVKAGSVGSARRWFDSRHGCCCSPVPGGVGATLKVVRNVDKVDDVVDAIKATERGREVEKTVLASEGLVKNTKTIQMVDPKTGQLGGTIPDAIRASG